MNLAISLNLKDTLNQLWENFTINSIYYSGSAIILILLWWFLWDDFREFNRMRVVMSIKPLLITILTSICILVEPIFMNHNWGYSMHLFGLSWVLTPTSVIFFIGMLWCGLYNAYLNYRIWRTEFPTRPYPKSWTAQ